MPDIVPARFFDLREISSDWRLTCPTHGDVTMVILFNNDIKNRCYCQQCFEDDIAKTTRRTVFNANGGPEPSAARIA